MKLRRRYTRYDKTKQYALTTEGYKRNRKHKKDVLASYHGALQELFRMEYGEDFFNLSKKEE